MLAAIAFLVIATSVSFAHAETPSAIPLTDSQVNLVIIASVIGVLVAPIVGFATQPTPAPPAAGQPAPTKDPNAFNWKQYALSLIIGIPSVMTILMAEINGLHATVTGYQGNILLFLMAFMQGLAVDYGKSRIQKAITNNS